MLFIYVYQPIRLAQPKVTSFTRRSLYSTGAKIQKNDDCLRGVTHQSGTSVGLSLGEDVVGELDCDLDCKSEML